jgi:hypothetical protein
LQAHRNIPNLTEQKFKRYNEATHCKNCQFQFFTERDDGQRVNKVRHHNHITGKFISAWCWRRNLRAGQKHSKTIVCFHSFKDYDSPFILKYAAKYLKDKNSVNNTQKIKYIIIRKNQAVSNGLFMFMDNFNHLNASLDDLVSNLIKSNTILETADRFNLDQKDIIMLEKYDLL